MAPSSPLRSNALYHGRSLSLPSATHPAISHFDDNLSGLRSSEAACSSLSSVNGRINGLRNLYESIDDLLLFQHNISEECVDSCISLLDACTSVKDIISLVKQDLRHLLSAVRRKDVEGINGYLSSKKNLQENDQKIIEKLKAQRIPARFERESEDMSIAYMLKQAESILFLIQ